MLCPQQAKVKVFQVGQRKYVVDENKAIKMAVLHCCRIDSRPSQAVKIRYTPVLSFINLELFGKTDISFAVVHVV